VHLCLARDCTLDRCKKVRTQRHNPRQPKNQLASARGVFGGMRQGREAKHKAQIPRHRERQPRSSGDVSPMAGTHDLMNRHLRTLAWFISLQQK
jgi:hypothetical protein